MVCALYMGFFEESDEVIDELEDVGTRCVESMCFVCCMHGTTIIQMGFTVRVDHRA